MGSKHAWKVELLSDTLPDRGKVLEQHTSAYPKAHPLKDTAAEIRLVPRQPTNVEFIPIGHVALDVHEPEEDVELGLPATGTVWVHQLYISRALHGGGFGAGAMSKIEALATQSPMNAKIVALDTLSKEMQTEPEIRDLLYGKGGVPLPVVSNEEWYISQGYEVLKRHKNAWIWSPREGIDVPGKNISFASGSSCYSKACAVVSSQPDRGPVAGGTCLTTHKRFQSLGVLRNG
ncbi:hypothetical protein Daesc_000487 [Daldinia eschscholtzii]|uniref:N-acetyltransferase domain-containing protein n=1 Tax=Daldinia eschscholtzii TaxID=292717 RepID=A0AAX6MYG3_9PEZI